jgi:hypothetical protein
MKKKLFVSTIALILGSFVSVQARVVKVSSFVEFIVQDKVPVKPEDLPQPIKTTLASDVYAGWDITEAYLVTKEDKTQYYEISLKKESETTKINLNKDGRKVD